MPLGLKRYQRSKQSHFMTFTCYRRLRKRKRSGKAPHLAAGEQLMIQRGHGGQMWATRPKAALSMATLDANAKAKVLAGGMDFHLQHCDKSVI